MTQFDVEITESEAVSVEVDESVSRYTDTEAVDAVEATSISLSGNLSVPDGSEVIGGGLVHQTYIADGETLEIPAEHGSVIAGPLTGDGAITGSGRLKII